MKSSSHITFEQPLNEYIRICLKLEQLFYQLDAQIQDPSSSASKQAITTLVRILEVIDRPDLKSKFTQSLTQHASTLAQFERLPQVNKDALQDFLQQLDRLVDCYHSKTQRLDERLRNNEFLNQLRLGLVNPGGISPDRIPSYALWLAKASDERQSNLRHWTSELQIVRQTAEIILRLTRESAKPQKITALEGFYHQALDPNTPCELVRVTLSKELNVYPEFSFGRHLLTIRLLQLDYKETGRPTQVQDSIDLELSCCRV